MYPAAEAERGRKTRRTCHGMPGRCLLELDNAVGEQIQARGGRLGERTARDRK